MSGDTSEVKINIVNFIHDNIEYYVINNDLYAKINYNNIQNNIINLYFLNDEVTNFNLNNINSENNEFGNIYKFNNFGLPYYNNSSNIVDINNCELKRGDLYFIILN